MRTQQQVSPLLARIYTAMILPYLLLLGQLNEFAMPETILHNPNCPVGFFPCGNLSVCIPQSSHCNKVKDCENGADEEDCDDNTGLAGVLENLLTPTHNENMSEDCLLQDYPKKCDCQETELECVDVNLRYVPKVSVNVTLLSLKNNKIKSLPSDVFIIFKDLEELYLQNNQIRSISKTAFSGLYKLRRLYISHNRIIVLKPRIFQDLHKLKILFLDDNFISKISPSFFIGLKSLLILSMVNNILENLPKKTICAEIPNVHWLDFDSNRIKSLNYSTFLGCDKLIVLYIQQNEIITVSEKTFAPLHSLIELEISSNKIQELPKHLFKNAKLLIKLNISNNPLKFIHPDQFDALSQLQSLGIEGIEIANIESRMFKPMTKLEHIYFNKFQYCAYSPHVRSCKPNTDGISSFEDLLANIILRVFVWVIACVTCFGNLFVIFMRSRIRAENKLHATSIKILCCLNLIAFIIIVFSYSSMFYSIHKSGIRTPEMKSHIRSEVAVAYRFFFIVLSDALCWIPIFLLKVLSLIKVEIPGTITSWVVIFILPINSALNPILYTLTTSFFREKMKQFLCKHQKNHGNGMWAECSSRQSTSSVKQGFLKRVSAIENVMNSQHH
ncbi:relaxin receptor 2-like isoform X2 [Chiloscyllium plagiosum]|uniref:relaxin receptor 2-like isoform X2 n=1 Tax=Chiloscyllium plagiosum TaxID=36176 RepID=UPI001CB7DA74|nr:relaxin receptor 2-like isoform X2 [Chiloscyllium plagiosum]